MQEINENINVHCVKSLRENAELFLVRIFCYSVNLRIQSKYRKIWTRNNSVFWHFSRSGQLAKNNTFSEHLQSSEV